MRTKLVNISDLKLAKYNPRQISEHDMASLVNSIREFGIVEPVVVNKNNTVIGGHQRLIACQQLSITQVPVVYVDLPKKKEKTLNLALNRIHGDWDQGKLASVLEELKMGNGDEIGLTGFELGEIDEIIDSQISEAEGEDNFDAESEASKIKNPKSKRGEVYELGRHRLMCGDATVKADVEKLMDGKKADMVFTDPPYGINIVKGGSIGGDCICPAGQYESIVGDDKPFDPSHLFTLSEKLICWGANYYAERLPRKSGWIVWDKRDGVESNNFADCELAWTSFDSPARIYRCFWQGMIKEGESGKRLHPTQKPVKLFILILNDYAERGCLVIDLYGGSGTTLIAAEKTGRVCYMMEIDPVYCDVIQKRYEEYVSKEGKSIAQNGAKSAVGA